MFVCLCKSVTDHQIRNAVDQGVTSFDAMQAHLEVSTVCGACTCEVKQVMEKKLQTEVHKHRNEIFLGAPAYR
ncbi:(2Fe-2S)-binding protein [Arenicella xantha]|uniref:Bacterioferritin-associated ferredoxin n=1 Tax=Arenicella xantha TaxID=644221 RepID=A0A395JFK2_9GAMM|nr:(2Fe-2S)-binding protein [Arenicella xantha]RBP47056.1 bacterioferritin-associated ferredoxin [Arenicella xantha]